MPTYGYTCEACGADHEIFHRMQDVVTECPTCHKHELKKQIGAGGGIIFKGTGFYETDYKRKKPPGEGGRRDGGNS